MYPPVIFNGRQEATIAHGFVDVVRRTGCVIHACAIMPDHTHLVVARHRYPIQQVANLLKGGVTTMMRRYKLDPFAAFGGAPQGRAPFPWPHKFWKVWSDSDADIGRSINYVNENPIKHA